MNIIKVSATSRTSAVAGAIAGVIRENNRAEVQAIGAGAVNQAVKAMILANGYLKEEGLSITAVPEFVDVEIDEKVRTAIKLVITPIPYDNSQVERKEQSEVLEEPIKADEEPEVFETTVVPESFLELERSMENEATGSTEKESDGQEVSG